MSHKTTEKYKKLAEAGGPLHGLFVVKEIAGVNHKPHPFTVGPRHVSYASDHNGGMLTEEVCRKIPCAASRCGIPYDQHTYETVLFLSLVRNISNKEAADALLAIKGDLIEDGIDGVSFVETPEKFRIAPPEPEKEKSDVDVP